LPGSCFFKKNIHFSRSFGFFQLSVLPVPGHFTNKSLINQRMSVNKDRIQYLLDQYLKKKCSHEELQELFACIAQPENRELLQELMDTEYETLQPLAADRETDWEHMFQQAVQVKDDNVLPLDNRKRFQWLRVAAAAIIVLALGTAGYWFINRQDNKITKKEQPVPRTAEDVLPGSNKAVLTLANGAVIVLDSARNGSLAQQGNADVIKQTDGQLIYRREDGKSGGQLTIDHSPADSYRETYNTLATPRGGQYHLVLPDGTNVWLNAASSLRYPVTFAGNERSVELSGEAYFEVAKDARKPFHVITPAQDVEVLGTHFNVNAYNDETAVKTTLLEGSVKVVKRETVPQGGSKENSEILKPGEQAVLSRTHSPLTTRHSPFTIDHSPDLEQVMAWKNGFTSFSKADIKSIMRQVARWYNVEVVYEGDIPQRSFTGGISRSARLSELLRLLEVSKVHFRIEGNRLIVTP
jgi:transmembrane sensor